MVAPQSDARPRRKVHASTWVFGGLVAAVILLLNLSGPRLLEDEETWAVDEVYPGYYLMDHQHVGWPFSFLVLLPGAEDVPSRVERFVAFGLALDVAIAFGIVLLACLGFEFWRRRRRAGFRVSDLLILVVVVAAGFALVNHHRAQYERELNALRAIPKSTQRMSMRFDVQWQTGGPSWLRSRISHRGLEIFDRVVEIEVKPNELEHVAQLQHLKVVNIEGVPSSDQLRVLARLPALDAVAISLMRSGGIAQANGARDHDWAKFPPLPKMRVLEIEGIPFRGDGLEHQPALQAVNLNSTAINDDALRRVARLSGLRYIVLDHTAVTNAGLVHLRELDQLVGLGLVKTQVDHVGLVSLPQLAQLRGLALGGDQVTDDAIEVLYRAESLESLTLADTALTDLAFLGDMRGLKTLALYGRDIRDEVVPTLARLKQLKCIRFHHDAITRKNLRELRAQLPDGCELDLQFMGWNRAATVAENVSGDP